MLSLMNAYVIDELAMQRELAARRSRSRVVRGHRTWTRRAHTTRHTSWRLGHRVAAGH